MTMLLIELLYFISALLLALYGFAAVLYTAIYWKFRRQVNAIGNEPAQQEPASVPVQGISPDIELPPVTVQLPIFNERHVVERIIRSAVALDWPAESLQIQILDDSTDDTTELIAAIIQRLDRPGVQLEHIHRMVRHGFKAGALQEGLASATGQYVAMFDADFVPPRDFLRRTIPLFADSDIGCVQTRWGHINRDSSQLTQSESLGIDGHFMVEQTVRNKIACVSQLQRYGRRMAEVLHGIRRRMARRHSHGRS